MEKTHDNLKYIYKTEDDFLLRRPLLSIDDAEYFNFKLEEQDKIDAYIQLIRNSSTIMEAILVSSNSLYTSIINYNSSTPFKKKKDILISTQKYVIRMSTRPTPYGLFSGISSCSFGNDCYIEQYRNSNITKRARVDMVWLYKLIEKLEKNQDVLNNLTISVNSTSYAHGDRVYLSYISNYGQARERKYDRDEFSSIRKSKVVDCIHEILKRPKTYSDLIDDLGSFYSDVEKQRIVDTVNELIQNEYLITSLRPSLSNSCKLLELTQKLNGSKDTELYLILNSLQVMIENYNDSLVGKGASMYLEILELMRSICTSESYLQVDMTVGESVLDVGYKNRIAIEHLTDLMSQLASPFPRYAHLDSYMENFLDVYGEDKIIKLKDLLDEDLGLGVPNTYRNLHGSSQKSITHNQSYSKMIQAIIYNKIQDANLTGKREIEFDNSDFIRLANKLSMDETPNSMELYFNVSYSKANKEYNLHFGEHLGVIDAGSTFGRFTDIDSGIDRNHKSIMKRKENFLSENAIYVQLNEFPNNGRFSNVTLTDSIYPHEMSIGSIVSQGKEQISLDEIYVGVIRENQKFMFFIFSSKLNKQLVFKSNNMLNSKTCSNYYRFLIEVSSMKEKCVISDFYINFHAPYRDFNYVPRFTYRNIVIKPASWRLSDSSLGYVLEKIRLDETFINKIKEWQHKYFVPRHLYIVDGDNRLLIDLSSEIGIEIIINELNKNKQEGVFFTEIEGQIHERVLFNSEPFFCEIVVPLVKRNIGESSIPFISSVQLNQIDKKISDLNNNNSKNTFYPTQEWMTFKLYGNTKRTNEFITKKIYPFVLRLKDEGVIEQFFFIRYADPKDHIRLRFKVHQNHQVVFSSINLWFTEASNEGFLTKVVLDTYVRETERYGGVDIIELIEDIFFVDSLFACELLSQAEDRLTIVEYCALSIILFLKALGMNYESQFSVLESLVDKAVGRENYRNNRKLLLEIVGTKGFEMLRTTKMGAVTLSYSEQINDVGLGLRHALEQSTVSLTKSKDSIYLSLVHMHCNRILGTRASETLSLGIARLILKDLVRNSDKIT